MSVEEYGRRGAEPLPWAASRAGIAAGTAALDLTAALVAVAVGVASWHRLADGAFGSFQRVLALAGLVATAFLIASMIEGRYRLANYLARKRQVTKAVGTWTLALVAIVLLAFIAGIPIQDEREALIAGYLIGIPAVASARLVAVRAVSIASKSRRIASERVFVIGREAEVMSFANRHQPWNLGLAIVDVAFLRGPGDRRINDAQAALEADLAAAVARCRALRPDAVFIALPWHERETIDSCTDAFMNLPVAIHLTPERIMDRFDSPHIVRLGTLTSLRLTRPALSRAQIAFKRLFDLAAGSVLLLAALPVLAAAAICIRLDTKGPVFFVQRRHGFNQQTFRILKLRTMTTMDDGDIVRQARANDPRITAVGRHLRRWNLDELPQLLNVIRGDMSLVGPRPHALAHDHEFERKIALYARRHNVKPGITGWAQVHGLRGETDTDEKMARRVAFDHWYIDNWSLGLDIAILLRTLTSPAAYRNAR